MRRRAVWRKGWKDTADGRKPVSWGREEYFHSYDGEGNETHDWGRLERVNMGA